MSKGMSIPKKFKSKLDSFRNNNPDEWEKHYRKATKRLLSSMFFLVSAKTVYESGNKLLSAIGYYYSLFHLSKALLFLLPQYSIEQLEGISHKKVQNMVKTCFVQRKMLPKTFIDVFEYTKQIREAANYDQDSWVGLNNLLKKNEPEIMKCVEDGVGLFKEICNKELTFISAIIGDGIGDDWRDSYLSEEESELLTSILLKHKITT